MMKRNSDKESDEANLMKKVNLVERNPKPCGLALVSPQRVGKHDSSDIVALAREIANADQALKNRASGKLSVILEQIRFLQQQAAKIIKETEESKELNEVACNFQKIPGKTYHLYRRESGQKYLSMLSPEEWGGTSNHEFLGSFRLEHDHSWTPEEDTADVDCKRLWSERLMLQGVSKVLELEDGENK
ncbi:uncharacterized protein C1orf50 [Lutzomyia longipalpis]|uniref:uncharacterized protein C1orf50 n=1 Tax=Lutzomyia longipalpis TaxID=7200 RepID=UPI00248404B5|nr:uncharacterized protein C1orf50 [Lutzomyia longipalpis]